MLPQLTYLGASFSQLHPDWRAALEEPHIFRALVEIDKKLAQQASQGQIIYPAKELIFHALTYHGPAEIRAVILGQDPYHGANEAMGLSFSVPSHVRIPPSLRNIYKELSTDLNLPPPSTGDLRYWAQQGVLLLNTVLTVSAKRANSHQRLGWHKVTDALIDVINKKNSGCVFLLWGNAAQTKLPRINTARHKILLAAHPSPLSAHRGFFGCQHFSQTNQWLLSQGKAPIQWFSQENRIETSIISSF